jgi:AcrR family transcriptional regulator
MNIRSAIKETVMPKTEEQCKKMREDMKCKILKMSSLYFAKNGFGDTKIGDLAKNIGIGQGTIYLYFKSKEELFDEIRKNADNAEEVKKLKLLTKLPIPAKTKIDKLSDEMCKRLASDEEFCVRITLLTQLLLEKDDMYSDDLYKELAKIIKQGQKEGSVIKGDALYLADLYWGNVYLYALKRLFGTNIKSLKKETLKRLLEEN